ncbi:Beta-galactosidase large subunit [Allorhodopirellula heiligendammensis]|uniref:Beta-galactosidase large subunit n=2 Tax=Allorhodopirellula heiligendammensis TaxID=2714739 RepID=A0A5C6BXZ5_9BACT|nr:Beta-galactosidase large subunit [Allorhodopirellula heiligendammensis]
MIMNVPRRPDILTLSLGAIFALLPALESYAERLDSTPWKYSLEQPADGWQSAAFDDSGWTTGEGGFGTRGTPNARIGTVWKTNDIWLRKTISLDNVPAHPALLMHYDEDTEVFINGELVVSKTGWADNYQTIPIEESKRGILKAGENTLAVHCRQNNGGQYIDVHVVDGDHVPSLPKMKPFVSELITKWGSEVTPDNVWQEYPRPQMARDNWNNLNGNWDYAVTDIKQTEQPRAWDGEILVPFCLESKLGGVQELLSEDEALWYRRTFPSRRADGQRTLLHFEAVDYASEVFVNGTSVGKHVGGNTPFTLDISEAIKDGDNQLIVRVEDATEAWQLNGKQRRNPGGIMYTQVSGIWQTVWTEQVPASHIADLTITTDAQTGTITIIPEIESSDAVAKVSVVVKDADQVVANYSGVADEIAITVPHAKRWTPDSPQLYHLEVALLDSNDKVLDSVNSYAGIRTVGKIRDKDGNLRMTLNGEVIFHWGPLDQGWWPDGLLTPPSDEGMKFDIEWLKAAGFNMIRKHIKIEPRRYYYYCDQIGMMVWQDQVSGGKNPPWTRMDKNPVDAEWPDEQHEQFMLEFERMIDELENHPCIVIWGPFNEAWGQHRTMEVGKWTVERDPSRLVNIASGGNFWPVGDIADQHSYPNPSFPFDPARYKDYVRVVGEFGGHGYPVEGHLWDASRENWGYGGLPKTKAEYRDRYVKSLEILDQLRLQGIAGGVYTQTTDVEGEINGLMSYDRKVIKIPAEELHELHQRLYE